jgi:hypothetical protein
MARKSANSKQAGVLKFLRTAGTKMPADLKRQRIAAAKAIIKQRFDQSRGIGRQGARLWGQLQERSNPPGADPANKRALDALLAMHKKLAAKKVAAPHVRPDLGGIFPGTISVKVTPPFDYAITIPTVIQGSPTVSGSANTNGQINGSAITATQGRNAGSFYCEMGLYFHPLAAGRLRLSASPSFSFQWWTNSLRAQSSVRSFGHAGLGIFTLDRLGHVGGGAQPDHLKMWDEQNTQEIRFDFGSSGNTPLSVELDVTPSLIYALFVSLDVHVEGVGWPGSLAGAVLAVNVPSFTYDFTIQPVLQA